MHRKSPRVAHQLTVNLPFVHVAWIHDLHEHAEILQFGNDEREIIAAPYSHVKHYVRLFTCTTSFHPPLDPVTWTMLIPQVRELRL